MKKEKKLSYKTLSNDSETQAEFSTLDVGARLLCSSAFFISKTDQLKVENSAQSTFLAIYTIALPVLTLSFRRHV
jgi:hypothetical protein